ncbi:MAG TPA: HAD-IIIA family hydrolase [Ignavibacteria bacterium]|nr:HAD-IIIA family hydrolase [Ignavibacteria bacterium]
MAKAIFLDRDGTLNSDVGYLSRKEDIEILPGAAGALAAFKELGFLNIIITNQSGVARGLLTENELKSIHDEFLRILNSGGRNLIDDIFYSPFYENGIVEKYSIPHDTRKPGTGMIDAAVKKYNIDLNESFFIGDSLVDMQCAQNAGVKKILVLTGYGDKTLETCKQEKIPLECVSENLAETVDFIRKSTERK